MEVLVERGASRADCCQKIVEKYGINFAILKQRTIEKKFFGLVPERVEVEFSLNKAYIPPVSVIKNDDSPIDFNEEKKKQFLKGVGKDPELIIKKVQEQDTSQQQIIEKLDEILKKNESPKKPDHPSLTRIVELLKLNDFSESYIARIMERTRKEIPLETLDDFNLLQNRILEWIGESIAIYDIPEKTEYEMFTSIKAARIMVLIGPTGVGKTTTIAKLAAIYGLGNLETRPISVRMITIDGIRIGARTQSEKYGEIMDIPVSYIVDDRRDLRKEIDLYSEETDLILIDTMGRNPKDSVRLGEMKEFLDVCGTRAETHLVISASTNTGNIENILRQFEPFNYKAVLLTKFDETIRVGNIISVLAEKEKPLSYITTGQNVPKDISKASVIKFLINLEGFRVDRDKMEKRFPAAEADQFLWG